MENSLFSKQTMNSLKRTKEYLDFESPSFISPFHKEGTLKLHFFNFFQ